MESYEGSGLWFLPDMSGAGVPGTLCVSERGEIRLSLIGSLDTEGGTPGEKRFPIILGSIDGPLGNTVTLVNCFLSRLRLGSSVGVREEYHVQRGLFGAHLRQESDLTFHSMQLRVGGLHAWVKPLSGLRQDFFGPEGEETTPLVSYSIPAPVVASVPGGEVSLGFGLSSSHDLKGITVTEEPTLSVTTETPLSEDELNKRFVVPLQNLLTFVCDSPQAVEGVSLWREDVLAAGDENPEIKVVAARVFPDGEEDSKSGWPKHLLFSVTDVQPDFSSFLNRWLSLSETYADACDVYFGLQYTPPTFVEHMFAGVVQALCLYYTRRADGVERRSQEERQYDGILSRLDGEDADWIRNRLGARLYPLPQDALTTLLSEHAEMMRPLLRQDVAGFVAEAANTLRYVLWRDREAKTVASRGTHLLWMTAKLRILMKLCLLKELAFPAEKVGAMFHSDTLYLHLARLNESQR